MRDVIVLTGPPKRFERGRSLLLDALVAVGYKDGGSAQDLEDVLLATDGHEFTFVTMAVTDCTRQLCTLLQEYTDGMVIWFGNTESSDHRPPAAFGQALVVIRDGRFVKQFIAELRSLRSPDPRATYRWCQRVFGPRVKTPTSEGWWNQVGRRSATSPIDACRR